MGQFVVNEAGFDAHVPVVPTDVIRAYQGGGDGEEALRPTAAGGFAKDEQACVRIEVTAQCDQ